MNVKYLTFACVVVSVISFTIALITYAKGYLDDVLCKTTNHSVIIYHNCSLSNCWKEPCFSGKNEGALIAACLFFAIGCVSLIALIIALLIFYKNVIYDKCVKIKETLKKQHQVSEIGKV